MAARAFVDTNVFVYLYTSDSPAKTEAARRLLLDDEFDLVISTQVLSEFYVTVTRKLAPPLSAAEAAEELAGLAELEVVSLTRNLVLDAVELGQQHQLSHWDALIVEAASRSGCEALFTEDLADGSILRGVAIANPFAVEAD